MTANQIRKSFEKAGIDTTGMIFGRDQVELFIDNGEGRADDEATDAVEKRFRQLYDWGGFVTGYGAYILRRNYTAPLEDYCGQSYTSEGE